jgi:hypothetical protein
MKKMFRNLIEIKKELEMSKELQLWNEKETDVLVEYQLQYGCLRQKFIRTEK